MTTASVQVETASRLHLGLFRFGGAEIQYGGVGLMVQPPGRSVTIEPAEYYCSGGAMAERIDEFANRLANFQGHDRLPSCRIESSGDVEPHTGLGSGTQLGLSVAAGLSRFMGLPDLSTAELAACAGRARRSAIGTHGFVHGGLIVERGRGEGEAFAPLECRMPVPTTWQVVLIRPATGVGLSGATEQRAFLDLPSVPESVTSRLIQIVGEQMLPALAEADFAGFSESVYSYGHLAGSCFTSVQGGPYNGPALNERVAWLRREGYAGVGQSSWGPTLFVLAEDSEQATRLERKLTECPTGEQLVCERATPCNHGAQIRQWSQ